MYSLKWSLQAPTKNDVIDEKVIAQLVKDGRYAEPNLPEGIYAVFREGMKFSFDLQAAQGKSTTVLTCISLSF